MTTTVFGYDVIELHDIAKLYGFEKGECARDLHSLINFWEFNKPKTPIDCVQMTARLIEARHHVGTAYVDEMVQRYVQTFGAAGT